MSDPYFRRATTVCFLLHAAICSFASAPLILEVLSPEIKTVTLRNPDNFMAPPVIRLDSDDRLILSFDILGDSHDYLRYRLIHCNHDWQPSMLLESEYIDGFNEATVDDYAYSSNTFTHYVNYRITIPGSGLTPLASGNYLLQVYPEENADSVLLQQRFSVSENAVAINGMVTSNTDRGFNTEWQQVALDIDLSGIEGIDPYRDLKVTVTQNNRQSTRRTITAPIRVEGNHAIFDHNKDLIFNAGNEYRRFETVKADSPGMHVDSVAFSDGRREAFLTIDLPRADLPYAYDRTQHGRFMVDEYSSTDPDLGADYVDVSFSLDMSRIEGYEVFVGGDLTGDIFDEHNRMVYDPETERYTLTLPLKQGSYNYQYLIRRINSASPADPSPIEGDFHETGNEYLVEVFYSPPGTRADRLIGTFLLE